LKENPVYQNDDLIGLPIGSQWKECAKGHAGMAYNLPPLSWLRAFEAAARLGNFTRAAEELLITPAAVSYQVRQLEQHLGYPLFDRVHREVVLTRLGQTYLPSVEKAFSDLSIATVSVFGERHRKPVRFRCLNSFGQLWMIPRLKAFQEAYPEIDLQMISASWAEVLNPDLFDIDVRFGDGAWTDGAVEFLLNDPIVPVCHPDLALDPGQRDLDGLAGATRLDIMGVVDTWESFFRSYAPPGSAAQRAAGGSEPVGPGTGRPWSRSCSCAGNACTALSGGWPTDQVFFQADQEPAQLFSGHIEPTPGAQPRCPGFLRLDDPRIEGLTGFT
jgi:LysR family glycine cleavage system transcriptional activator